VEDGRYVNACVKLGINVFDIVLSLFIFELVVGTVYHQDMKVFDRHGGSVIRTVVMEKNSLQLGPG
jgi:hypothetical protein